MAKSRVNWIKNTADQVFFDGDEYLVAARVENRRTRKKVWVFDIVTCKHSGDDMWFETADGHVVNCCDIEYFVPFDQMRP